MQTPSDRNQPSPRRMPNSLPPIEYSPNDLVRRVQAMGIVKFKGRRLRTSVALYGQLVTLRADRDVDGAYDVFYCHQRSTDSASTSPNPKGSECPHVLARVLPMSPVCADPQHLTPSLRSRCQGTLRSWFAASPRHALRGFRRQPVQACSHRSWSAYGWRTPRALGGGVRPGGTERVGLCRVVNEHLEMHGGFGVDVTGSR